MFPWKKKTEERAVEVSEKSGDELISAVFNSDKVSKEMALQIPAIAGSIDLIGGVVASTPIRLYKRIDNTIEEITNDNRVRLLNGETGDTLDSNQFWKAIVRDYYTGKGGYIYINKYRNHVKSLHYVDESKISIVDRDNPIFKDYDIYVNGQRYWNFDFIKILRNTKDGAKGSSIIDENSMLILVSYQSLKLELNASKRGGTKKGFLKSDRKIEEGAIAKLKAGFRRMFSDDSENFIVLNGGIDFKETSNTLAEMQLNENKQTNANEIAKIFHVSQELVSGNESDTTALAKLAAIPLMSAIESALNKDLLLEKEKGEYYFAFDTKELLKGDLTERFNAYKTALDANFMQIDEVRSKENLPELGLDFLKLGLQDVLYNPKTKEVFTPNTGKSQKIDESSLKEVLGNDILEERGNPNHDPKTGKFASSKTKGNVKNLNSELSADGSNEFKVKGFKNKQKLNNHWEKHKKDYISDGIKTKEDYLNKALDLVQSPCGDGIEGYKNKLGQICRYESKTNYYVKGNPEKGIFTMFKPKDGKKYFDNMKKNESEDKK